MIGCTCSMKQTMWRPFITAFTVKTHTEPLSFQWKVFSSMCSNSPIFIIPFSKDLKAIDNSLASFFSTLYCNVLRSFIISPCPKLKEVIERKLKGSLPHKAADTI
ncbi:MAG: hypothetical protein [Circular genetic element sp.]|nr:MAG: hypothetical protein [Circular genetic element sp.]